MSAVKVGVLASGYGSNLEALLETVHGREIVIAGVASDRIDARALTIADDAGIPTRAFPLAEFADRRQRDAAILGWLESEQVELVVLAGYMALLDPVFIDGFPDRIVNVHPSLLPAFPGINSIEQAVGHGVKVFGVTVHLVDAGIDTGAILLQGSVELDDVTSVDHVRGKLQRVEHRLLPEAVGLLAAGRVRRDPGNPKRLLIDRQGDNRDLQ